MGRRERVHIAREWERSEGVDLFDSFPPPFDVEADMLFVLSSAPSDRLARRFPEVRFIDVGGSTPLLLWFSRVTALDYGRPGDRRRLDQASGFGYNELNVLAAVRGFRSFVPVIYATEGLTQRLGHRYGMPKRPAPMTFSADTTGVESAATSSDRRSEARATLLASGRILGRALDLPTPWWSWPVDFPDGSFIRAQILRVPRAQLAHVSGRLSLEEPWLPDAAPLWPLGVFVPGLLMRLPAPEADV